MKKFIVFIFLIVFMSFFWSCGKFVSDLDRDNPYDTAYNGNDVDEMRFLEYYSHNVVCKYSQGATTYSSENTIKAGDEIFLNIKIKNPSNFSIEKIRGTFSCSSNFIQLAQPINGCYVRFSEIASHDKVSSGEIGWGEITDGYGYIGAPNDDSYVIKFFVSTSAATGSKFTIMMNLKDELNNNWIEAIDLSVQ